MINMMLGVAFILISLVTLTFAQSADAILSQFTSSPGSYVLNGTLVPGFQAASVDDCASACLKFQDCVSFNYLDDPSISNCELNQYKNTYKVISYGNWTYFLRNITRNDVPIKPQIQYTLQVPTRGVSLTTGLIKTVFDNNLIYLSGYPLDDLLYFYRIRSGEANPPGQCWGWDQNLQGSISGLFMMGAGNALRWVQNETLQARLDDLVAGIAQYQESDGFIMAYPKNNTIISENPNYVLSWVTHGLIDTYLQGNEQALQLARDQISWYNYNPYIPEYLPPYDEIEYKPQCSLSGCGDHEGHGIYLEYQGMIHNTLMALSPVGVERDVELLTTLYQEDYWLEQLIARNLSGIWERMWFPHNYELTGIEAYLDLYVLTGNQTYLDAVFGAWDMFYTHWIHVGGSIAINEVIFYPPGSYYLDGYDWGEELHESHSHSHSHTHSHNIYEHDNDAPCGGPSVGETKLHYMMNKKKIIEDPSDVPSGPHPTGENCGTVFWVKLNQRLHRLYPDNETYTTEIEREIYNVGVANQSPVGLGNRYFTVLHKSKAPPSNVGTCCEGQGTRFYGSLPEYIYSLSETGIYVDLFVASTFDFVYQGVNVTLKMDTLFPYANNVSIEIIAEKSVDFSLNIRVPSWAASPVTFAFNNTPSITGNPGSYVAWKTSTGDLRGTITFTLPMQFAAHYYNGTGTQIPPYSRYAYTYGPILLAAQGPWNTTLDCLVIPGVDPNAPGKWMTQVSPLHFNVTGATGYSFGPYFEVQQEVFTVYPIIA